KRPAEGVDAWLKTRPQRIRPSGDEGVDVVRQDDAESTVAEDPRGTLVEVEVVVAQEAGKVAGDQADDRGDGSADPVEGHGRHPQVAPPQLVCDAASAAQADPGGKIKA